MTDAASSDAVTAAEAMAGRGHDTEREDHRVETRAELLPEEESVGSDDPETQAAVILDDSERRTEVPNAAPTTHLERRTSEETA